MIKLSSMKLRIIVALLLASVFQISQAQFVHTEGTFLVDSTGREIQLRGPNLGCWLYFEPWMVGAGVFPNWLAAEGTTDTFQQSIVRLVGPAGAEQFWSAYRANMITEADIAAIARLGFNCVRVTLDYRLFYSDPEGTYLTANYQYIDNLLQWCAKYRVYAILDMHTVPGGQNIYDANSIYVEPGHQEVLRNIWKRVAARYSENPWVGGYDLMNEPVVNGDPGLKSEYQDLTTTIRSVDRHHTLFVEGDWYASSLWLLGKPWDLNMAYSDHNYASTLPNDLPAHEDQATLYNAPLWMGEFGFNSNVWNAQQESELDAETTMNGRSVRPSWSFWSWKAMSIWSMLNVKTPVAYQTLLNYWNGSGSRPSSSTAMAGLMSLAASVNYSSCQVSRDVVDGYTRSNFLTTCHPYLGNVLPGRIACVTYDMGPDGIAYHDDLSSNTGGMGSGFEAWNNGWIFRNDGVDITTGSGVGDLAYAVGWTDSGEWLNYTVACKPGTYNLTICYSGPGGNLHFLVNGVNVSGSVSLPEGPNGGSWGSYGTYTVPNVTVSASGLATLQIYEDTGGYNLNWVEFSHAGPTPPDR
jgi:endoglucanase